MFPQHVISLFLCLCSKCRAYSAFVTYCWLGWKQEKLVTPYCPKQEHWAASWELWHLWGDTLYVLKWKFLKDTWDCNSILQTVTQTQELSIQLELSMNYNSCFSVLICFCYKNIFPHSPELISHTSYSLRRIRSPSEPQTWYLPDFCLTYERY